MGWGAGRWTKSRTLLRPIGRARRSARADSPCSWLLILSENAANGNWSHSLDHDLALALTQRARPGIKSKSKSTIKSKSKRMPGIGITTSTEIAGNRKAEFRTTSGVKFPDRIKAYEREICSPLRRPRGRSDAWPARGQRQKTWSNTRDTTTKSRQPDPVFTKSLNPICQVRTPGCTSSSGLMKEMDAARKWRSQRFVRYRAVALCSAPGRATRAAAAFDMGCVRRW